MSNRDKFNWEQAFGHGRDVLLSIPSDDEIDLEWCASFQDSYGNGLKRTMLGSDFCFLQENPPGSPMSMQPVDLIDFTGTPQSVVEGRVMRVLLVPKVEDDTTHEPFIVLDEVTNPGHPLTRWAEQQVWVPLVGRDEIILFD